MMALPFLSAILGILAFLPPQFIGASLTLGGPANLWIFGFVFLAPLFVFFLKERRFWRLAGGAFIFRLFFGLGTAYVTLEPIMWISSILIFLGLPVSVFFIKKLTNFLSAKYSISLASYPLLLSLPFLWTLFDHLEARCSLLPTYVITAGNIFGSSPFSGLAGLGGLALLTFFAALTNTLIVVCILIYTKQRLCSNPQERNLGVAKCIKKINLKPLGLNLTALFFLILASWLISVYQIQKNSAYYNNLKNSLKVTVVSVNEKFDFRDSGQIKNELTAQKADLIVFPEDAFNEIWGMASLEFYRSLSVELGTNLVATFVTSQNGRRYNSTVLFNAKGEIAGVYNKNRLTFMGEYWPFKNWRPFFYDWFKKSNPGFENYAIFNPQNAYAKGDKKILSISQKDKIINPHTADLPPTSLREAERAGVGVNFTSLICMEIQYPNDLKEYKKTGVKFFINPASNRWINAGINHYLYLENNLRKLEAIWLKTPIITSGVKDFSGVILPDAKTNFAGYESAAKNYAIFTGEIKY